MKTKIKAILLTITMLLTIGICSKVQAASASISATKTNATVGDSVTISVNINAASWSLKVNGNGISGGSIVGYDPDGNNTSTSKTFKLNTSNAGTYKISLSGDVTDGNTDVNSKISSSVTVTVNNPAPVNPTNPTTPTKPNNPPANRPNTGNNSSSANKPTTTTNQPETKSNDATLKSLVVEGYELYPAFETSIKEYNLRVTNDITSVKLIPTVNDLKASYTVEGTTEDLQVGKNLVNIKVTAEDGTTSNYSVTITREREGLNVQYIKISYIDEEGNKQELELDPIFSTEIFEYTLKDLSYLVKKLDVEVLTNLEQAKIEITGNEEIVEGKNIITITITMASESEEEEDEVLTYTITVNREKEPVITLMGRIKNWFKGITGTISTWFTENQYKIVMGALMLCSACMGGISVYLVIEYKKYRLLMEKIAQITRMNNTNQNIIETVNITEGIDNKAEKIENENNDDGKSKGKHF